MKPIKYSFVLCLTTLFVIAGMYSDRPLLFAQDNSKTVKSDKNPSAKQKRSRSELGKKPAAIQLIKPTIFAEGLNKPWGMAFDKFDNLICAGQGADGQGRIVKISPEGKAELVIDSPKKTEDSTQYIIETLGKLEVIDSSIIALNHATGTVYRLILRENNVAGILESRYGASRCYESVTTPNGEKSWRAGVCSGMALDTAGRTLYVGVNASRARAFGTVQVIVIKKSNLAEITEEKEFFELDYIDYPSITSMAYHDSDLYAFMTGYGIVKITRDKKLLKLDEKDAFTDQRFDSTHNYVRDRFKDMKILDMLFDEDGNMYVAANQNDSEGCIYMLPAPGGPARIIAKGFTKPAGLALKNGSLYVSDNSQGKIYKVRLPGKSRK